MEDLLLKLINLRMKDGSRVTAFQMTGDSSFPVFLGPDFLMNKTNTDESAQVFGAMQLYEFLLEKSKGEISVSGDIKELKETVDALESLKIEVTCAISKLQKQLMRLATGKPSVASFFEEMSKKNMENPNVFREELEEVIRSIKCKNIEMEKKQSTHSQRKSIAR